MFTRAQTDAIEKLLYKHAHRTSIGGAHYVTHQEFDNLLKELEDMTHDDATLGRSDCTEGAEAAGPR